MLKLTRGGLGGVSIVNFALVSSIPRLIACSFSDIASYTAAGIDTCLPSWLS